MPGYEVTDPPVMEGGPGFAQLYYCSSEAYGLSGTALPLVSGTLQQWKLTQLYMYESYTALSIWLSQMWSVLKVEQLSCS